MLRFSLLGSGSSGNAVLVRTPAGAVLIDDGLSFKQLVRRAAALGESLDGLKAVFVTHEHGDHVNGLGTLARRLDVPVYMTEATHYHLPKSVGVLPKYAFIESGDSVTLGELTVQSFAVSHDAADPVSYVVRYGGRQLGMATDLGYCCNVVEGALRGSNALILESNYCPKMLQTSSYPPAIRQRIRNRLGHLSNRDMSSLLHKLLHEKLEHVVLVHISEENNTPALALASAAQVINGHGAKVVVAHRSEPTGVFELAS